jgi:hypothetical protein
MGFSLLGWFTDLLVGWGSIGHGACATTTGSSVAKGTWLVNWLTEFFNRVACLYWRASSSGSDSLRRKRGTREAASNAAREVTRLGGTFGDLKFETFGAVSLGGTVSSGSNPEIFGAVSLGGAVGGPIVKWSESSTLTWMFSLAGIIESVLFGPQGT